MARVSLVKEKGAKYVSIYRYDGPQGTSYQVNLNIKNPYTHQKDAIVPS